MELKNKIQNFILQYYQIIILTIIIILGFFFFYSIYMRNTIRKVVVFDLDETLGCFIQLGVFCDAIEKYYKKKLTITEFHNIMELFPEFLRPNILKVLSFLKEKKQNGHLYKVYLYTNNQGPKSWSEKICLYLEKKINYKLFDKIIGAWKVNGKQVELTRTTHEKTFADLLRSTNLSRNTEICFIDDLYHSQMDTSNVHYINIVPYKVSIPINTMSERFYKYNKQTISNKLKFTAFIKTFINRYDLSFIEKSQAIKHNDTVIGKELLLELQTFLQVRPKVSTKKNKSQKKNNTKKNNTIKQ